MTKNSPFTIPVAGPHTAATSTALLDRLRVVTLTMPACSPGMWYPHHYIITTAKVPPPERITKSTSRMGTC